MTKEKNPAFRQLAFVWAYLPVFFLWFAGFTIIIKSLHKISPPMTDSVWLSVIPLIASLVLIWFASKKEKFSSRVYIGWALIMVVGYIIPFLFSIEENKTMDLVAMQRRYEIVVLIHFFILFIHCITTMEKKDILWIYVITLLYGTLVENSGVDLNAFTETGYRYYFPGLPAPFCTFLGWTTVMYICFFIVERVLPYRNLLLKGFICGCIGLAIDLPLDPFATRIGLWVWNDSLTNTIYDVPLFNFVGWFWVVFTYAAFYYWIRGKATLSEKQKLIRIIPLVPVIMIINVVGVLCTLTIAGDSSALMLFKEYFAKKLPFSF